MTIATAVTLLRLVLLPPLAFLIFTPQHPALSVAVFGGAAATDWLDGLIARRWNQVTRLGARLDPLVDKVFIYVLVVLLWHATIFVWPVVLIAVLRDLSVQVFRSRAPERKPLPANRWGKLKFVLQCVAIAIAFVALNSAAPTALRVMANLVLLAAIVVSLPGLVLIVRAQKSQRSQPEDGLTLV
jgi:CDP-diacylglycerol--glycerol-3-phosphate 3-phosphatidyltransferase